MSNKPLGGETTAVAVTMLVRVHRRLAEYCSRNGIAMSAFLRDAGEARLDEVAPEDTEP